ncbi:MAG: HlyD family efflux transporter periplasmic adaptor subunit [Pirellulales bacterium]
MSNDESVDPELVEQTKQQIRELVNEIADLAQQDIPEKDFYSGFLDRVVTALAANGGAVWDVSGGRIELAAEIGLRGSGLVASEDAQLAHGRLLRKMIVGGEALLVDPHAAAGDDEEDGSNPTDHLLVLGLLRADQEVQSVVEIFQRSGTPETTQQGYLRFVIQMCDLAGDYLKTRSLRRYGARQSLANQVEQFTRLVHRSLDPRISAYALANEGRRLIDCDRVTVAVMRGSNCKIEAVSGQDTFDKRSNTIVLLQELTNAVARQGDPVWYTGDTTDMPPQVEDAIQAYVDESHSKTVAILPLRREKVVDETKDRDNEPEDIVGALVVEQIEDTKLREGFVQRVEMVARHGASGLANAVEHHNLFLMPLWRAIGKTKILVRARTLPKTVTITLASLAVILAMCIVPMDYNLEGDATLQPALRRDVFATVPGNVRKLLVNSGDVVEKGAPLVELENVQLRLELAKIRSEADQTAERMDALDRQLSGSLNLQDRKQLEGQLATADDSLRGLQAQLDLMAKRLEDEIVRAPIDGIVTTWDVQQKLFNRPVEVGEVLMTIADTSEDANWELEVKMPEHRIGDVSEQMAALAKENEGITKDEDKKKMEVKYVLATNPKHDYTDYVSSVSLTADSEGEKGSHVKMLVPISEPSRKELGKQLRPGATVKAKAYCGRRAVGYVLFRDLVNFVHQRILFKFF